MIGLLVGTATLALAATAFADVPVETLPPALPPAETPAAAPAPTVEQPVLAEVPVAEVPVAELPVAQVPPPAAVEELPAEAPPAAAASPPPEVTFAAAPRATGERRVRLAAPPSRRVSQGDGSGEAEPDCVFTAPDGSCTLQSTDCDILGDDGDNELFGTPNGEIICGLGGDDLLGGGGGEDTLVGGPGADRLAGGDDDDCILSDDEDLGVSDPAPESGGGEDRPPGNVHEPYLARCALTVRTYANALRVQGGVDTGSGAGDVANVGALYVALTRYASTQGETHSAGAIAVIATGAVSYSNGEIRFLVTCSRTGEVRVTLAALRGNGRRVRLGATTFRCQGEGDDPIVSVELSGQGRRVVERSTRVRIRAQLAEAGARKAAGQTFVLSP